MGCHVLLQGIFPTQGPNPHLLLWQVDSTTESPVKPSWKYSFMYFISPRKVLDCLFYRMLSSFSGTAISNKFSGLFLCFLASLLHWAFLVAQTVKNACNMGTWLQSLGWEDPLEEGMATHSSILAWRIPMDRRTWWATMHRVPDSWTRLSD